MTTLGGWHSSDGVAWKMKTITRGWWALMSGSTSNLTAMGYALVEGLKGKKQQKFLQFARLCVKIYKDERQKLIETEVLSDYDVDSYADYRYLKPTDRDFYDAIAEKVREFDDKMYCLICGFEKRTPHIFIISGPGNLSFCDLQGFGTIGAGAVAAQFSLDRHPYNRAKSMGDCIFAVLAAKFCAESADGVGPDSVLFVFTPEPPWKMQNYLQGPAIQHYKELWKTLPKIPEGVERMIEVNIQAHIQIRKQLSSGGQER